MITTTPCLKILKPKRANDNGVLFVCFTGFGSSGMDYGMVGGKEAGTESRFKQWTMMEGLPSVASQDANMHKNGEKGSGYFRNALAVSSCQG